MSIWRNPRDETLHDDADGAALMLLSWPCGMILLTNDEVVAAQAPTPAQIRAGLVVAAQASLDKVTGPSGTIMRCLAAGVPVPPEWSAYVMQLRALATNKDTTSTTLPVQPAYPEGT